MLHPFNKTRSLGSPARRAMPPPHDDEALEVCDHVDGLDDHDVLEASAALKDITKNVNSFMSRQDKVPRRPPRPRPPAGADGRAAPPPPRSNPTTSARRRARRCPAWRRRTRARGVRTRSRRGARPRAPRPQKHDFDVDDAPGIKDLHQMQDRIAQLLSGLETAATDAEAK